MGERYGQLLKFVAGRVCEQTRHIHHDQLDEVKIQVTHPVQENFLYPEHKYKLEVGDQSSTCVTRGLDLNRARYPVIISARTGGGGADINTRVSSLVQLLQDTPVHLTEADFSPPSL